MRFSSRSLATGLMTAASLVFGFLGVLLPMPRAAAGVILAGAGMSAAGHPVAVRAELSITGDLLTVHLKNTSPVDSSATADVLSSFYFDIAGPDGRPPLAYQAASGFVWQVRNNAADIPFNYVPPITGGENGTYTAAIGDTPHVLSDLMATKTNDRTWQFRGLDPAKAPGLGFGLGTVGTNAFSPNGFDPFIVGPPGRDQIRFGIFKGGDIDPVGRPLVDQYLVQNEVTFTFSGLAGFTEAHISRDAVFGFGTAPDTVIHLPEPGGWLVAGASLVVAGIVLLREARGSLALGALAAGIAICLMASSPAAAAAAPIVVDDAFDITAGPEGGGQPSKSDFDVGFRGTVEDAVVIRDQAGRMFGFCQATGTGGSSTKIL